MARFTMTFAIAALLAAAVGARGQNGNGTEARWTQTIALVEKASLRGDTAALEQALADVVALVPQAEDPRTRALYLYGAAYTRWRMAVFPEVPGKRKEELLEASVDDLDKAIAIGPSAEAYSLKSSVLGLQIGTSMWRGMTLGPRIGSVMGKAKELEPANPRVVLSEGVGAFHTPSMFGGGHDKAENLLRQALVLFEKEPRDKPWPNWGRFDTHAWLGQVLVERRDFAGAREQYERARVEAPESGWLRYILLPALERAQKARSR